MIIHPHLVQGSDEWLAMRAGNITSSESGPFVINSGKVAEGARQKLIDRKLAEWAGEIEPNYQNDAMKRGNALEPIARMEYRKMIGGAHCDIGFISHDTLPIGCSPDNIVLSREMVETEAPYIISSLIIGGAEIKAPQGNTQIRYLREAVLPEEYKFQVHHCMAITGAPWWDFYSFCPLVTQWTKTRDMWGCDEWQNGKIPSFYIRTHRDAFTEQLAKGLQDLAHDFLRQKAWLQSL